MRIVAFLLVSVATALASLACGEQSALDPQTSQAREVNTIWWVMLGIATAVFVLLLAVLLLALFRRERNPERDERRANIGVLLFGVALPAVVIVGLMAAMLGMLSDESSAEDALTIEVIGHRWWWEVRYPDYGFETANEIHVPLDRQIRLELSSNDVIHSFWVPSLQWKMDLIPGQINELLLRVEDPGIYQGQCAEFCGVQHANMRVFIIGDEDFETWAEGQQEPAPVPVDPNIVRGQEIFFSSSCVYCHAIQGTGASGEVGPDLTHIASRRTLAAGTLQNNTGTLVGWINNPHAVKPGNLMPASDMGGEDLIALVEFLNSLE